MVVALTVARPHRKNQTGLTTRLRAGNYSDRARLAAGRESVSDLAHARTHGAWSESGTHRPPQYRRHTAPLFSLTLVTAEYLSTINSYFIAAMQARRSNQTEPIIYVLGRVFLIFRDVIGRVARSIPPKTPPISGETLAFKRQNWTAVISFAANWPVP